MATVDQIREYANKQGFKPNATTGAYDVADDAMAARIYGHARDQGFTSSELDTALNWKAGTADGWITKNNMPGLKGFNPKIRHDTRGDTPNPFNPKIRHDTRGIVGKALVDPAPNVPGGTPALNYAPLGNEYFNRYGRINIPTDMSAAGSEGGVPAWAENDPYLRRMYESGWTRDANGAWAKRIGTKKGYDAAANSLENILRSEYQKMEESRDFSGLEEFERQRTQALLDLDKNFAFSLADGESPLTEEQRRDSALKAYQTLSGISGFSVDGSDGKYRIGGASDYDGFNKYKTTIDEHGGLVNDEAFKSFVAPATGRLTGLVTEADRTHRSDEGGAYRDFGALDAAGKSRYENSYKNLFSNQKAKKVADNLFGLTSNARPMEAAGPVAGRTTVFGGQGGPVEPDEPAAPLQTPRLANGIIGNRM